MRSMHTKLASRNSVALFASVLLFLRVELTAASAEECYNEGFTFEPTDWDKAIKNGEPPRLKLEKIWTSRKTPNIPVTVVTHTAINRDRHIMQCRTWYGPMVAAVYMPLVQANGTTLGLEQQHRLNDTIRLLDRVHTRVEKDSRCQLTLMLIWEVFTSAQDTWLYPHNSLRNWALLQVRTPMVAMVDVDLMISGSLSKDLALEHNAQALQQQLQKKSVMLFAAFEPRNKTGNIMRGRRLVVQAVEGGKQRLTGLLESNQAMRFLDDKFPPAQNATLYDRWMTATEPYAVPYAWHYEPWFIIDRHMNPFYDIKYRGYFFDKVLHAAHLNHTGFSFLVHPTAFIMHRPHPVSKIWSSNQLFDDLHFVMSTRAKQALALMANGTYTPAIDAATSRCQGRLEWWTKPQYEFKDPANWAAGKTPAQQSLLR